MHTAGPPGPPSDKQSEAGLVWRPATGPGQQLFILLPDAEAPGEQMLIIARQLRDVFPQAILFFPATLPATAPAGLSGAGMSDTGDVTLAQTPAAVIAAQLPAVVALVRQAQARFAIAPAATALIGFAHGASLALALSAAHDGLVGRVIAFAGSYAELPQAANEQTTIHLLHGEDDTVIPVSRAREAYLRLDSLHGDATLDIASGVGHEAHPALVERAIERLQTCVPLRLWREALE